VAGRGVSATGGRGVLVTGASRGIGRAVARAFAALGDRVAVHHRSSPELAEETRRSLDGVGHLVVSAELGDPESVRRMVDDAIAGLGRVDVLVNNAAMYGEHRIADVSYQEWQDAWREILGVNLVGSANVTYCVVHHMLAARTRGRVVNISSRGAYRGEPRVPAYGASKAGLNSFTGSMARALAPHGIAISGVAPGFVETDMANEALKEPRGAEIRAQSPFDRVAQPEEVAAAVVYLASPEAEFASGTVIDVNGASYLRC
jgi:3-oxoacyl-[acyl-carrier protein] reductase